MTRATIDKSCEAGGQEHRQVAEDGVAFVDDNGAFSLDGLAHGLRGAHVDLWRRHMFDEVGFEFDLSS